MDLPTTAFGITFPNPVGLAAGLDKNADHLDALAALGFGFIEVGTVTPLPQSGNDKPRMFRLAGHEAIINRLGFNNGGVEALVRNVQKAAYRGVLGINIGKNKDTPNERAVDDYLICLRRVHEYASYITVNISSPNTQGLRDLQEEATLRRFISARCARRKEQLGSQQGKRKPMLLKIAPDLAEAELDAIAEVLLDTGIDGVICTNTTIDHAAVADDPQEYRDGRALRQAAVRSRHGRAGRHEPSRAGSHCAGRRRRHSRRQQRGGESRGRRGAGADLLRADLSRAAADRRMRQRKCADSGEDTQCRLSA